jgi:hypothetical protein
MGNPIAYLATPRGGEINSRVFALRSNAEIPSLVNTVTSVASREAKKLCLLSLPLYMVGQASRLIKEATLQIAATI